MADAINSTISSPLYSDQPCSKCQRALGGILVRKECWSLSFAGKILLFLMMLGMAALVHYNVYPFLAVSHSTQAEFMVVEGWVPARGLQQAKGIFDVGGYRKLLTSGCAVTDEWSGEHKVTYADWGASKLRKLGMLTNVIEAVPCWESQKDRTYYSALAISNYFQQRGINVKSIDLVSNGPHARRSQVLFQKALGDQVKVGIIALQPDDYDTKHWWRSSEGVREVIGESIAYLYAKFFFTPSDNN